MTAPRASRWTAWADAVRLAVGTFTIVATTPPRRVDRHVAARSMLLAPVVGLLIGLSAGVVLISSREVFAEPRLAAGLTIAWIALLTRGLHLDGLADSADGFGAAVRGREAALEAMRQPGIGAFGAITVVLVLMLQVLALGSAVLAGFGTVAVVTACVVGRLAATCACVRGIPAARGDGLGAAVAGSVSRTAAALLTVAVLALAGLAGGLVDDDAGFAEALLALTAVGVGLCFGGVVLWRGVRRLGGVTGDLLGAIVELSTLGVLLTLAS